MLRLEAGRMFAVGQLHTEPKGLNCVHCDAGVENKQVLTLASKGRNFLDVQVIREQKTVNTAPILNDAPIPNTFSAAHMPHSAHNGFHVQPLFVSQSVQVSFCVGLAFWHGSLWVSHSTCVI